MADVVVFEPPRIPDTPPPPLTYPPGMFDPGPEPDDSGHVWKLRGFVVAIAFVSIVTYSAVGYYDGAYDARHPEAAGTSYIARALQFSPTYRAAHFLCVPRGETH